MAKITKNTAEVEVEIKTAVATKAQTTPKKEAEMAKEEEITLTVDEKGLPITRDESGKLIYGIGKAMFRAKDNEVFASAIEAGTATKADGDKAWLQYSLDVEREVMLPRWKDKVKSSETSIAEMEEDLAEFDVEATEEVKLEREMAALTRRLEAKREALKLLKSVEEI